MYILKNALKSISRSKGRNILIGIIVVIITASSCIALSINNSANELVKNQETSTEIKASLSLNRQKLMQDTQSSGGDMKEAMANTPKLSIDDINKYGKSSYVKSFYYTLSGTINSSNIEAYETTTDSSSTSSNSKSGQAGMNGDRIPNVGRLSRGDFSIVGYSSVSAMTDFINGTCKITSGEMFEDTNKGKVCVITKELAAINSLSVGSKITLVNPNDETQSYEFTVAGIYENSSSGDLNNQFMPSTSMDPANKIITSYMALNNIVTASNTASDSTDTAISAQLNSTFILKDANSVDGFTSDLSKMGLNKYYTVSTNLDSIDQSLTPLKNLSSFARIFLLIVLGIGGIILVILNMINIRERKYEIGVLTAVGMKKSKVALQFISELFMVTLISIIIGSAMGSAASVPTANSLLKKQISEQQTVQQQVNNNFGRPGGFQGSNLQNGSIRGSEQRGNGPMGGFFGMKQNVSYVDQINAVVNGTVLLEILGIGILLTLFSSTVSVIFISRYEPLKILSNRA